MKAPQAAGKIHSDMERGFIRAEVYHYDDLLACGSEAKVKKWLVTPRRQGLREQRADIEYLRFNPESGAIFPLRYRNCEDGALLARHCRDCTGSYF